MIYNNVKIIKADIVNQAKLKINGSELMTYQDGFTLVNSIQGLKYKILYKQGLYVHNFDLFPLKYQVGSLNFSVCDDSVLKLKLNQKFSFKRCETNVNYSIFDICYR